MENLASVNNAQNLADNADELDHAQSSPSAFVRGNQHFSPDKRYSKMYTEDEEEKDELFKYQEYANNQNEGIGTRDDNKLNENSSLASFNQESDNTQAIEQANLCDMLIQEIEELERKIMAKNSEKSTLESDKKEIRDKLDTIGIDLPEEAEDLNVDLQEQISLLKIEENEYSKQLSKLTNFFKGKNQFQFFDFTIDKILDLKYYLTFR